MPRTSAVWSAPSVDNLAHKYLRLDCEPETVRAVWRARGKAAALTALTAHFARNDAPGAQEHRDKAEAMYEAHALRDRAGFISPIDLRRRLINTLAGFHGVELLGDHARSGKTVYFCNAGDSYAPTLFFMGRRLFVDTVGGLIESRRVKERT